MTSWVARFLGKAKDLRSRNPNLVAWPLSNYVTLWKSPLWASHLHIYRTWALDYVTSEALSSTNPSNSEIFVRFPHCPSLSFVSGPPGQCTGRKGGRLAPGRPGTDGLPLLTSAVPQSRPRLPRLRASTPPFPASTVASEQHLGLASRLNTGSPSPRLLPTCRSRA